MVIKITGKDYLVRWISLYMVIPISAKKLYGKHYVVIQIPGNCCILTQIPGKCHMVT